MSFNNRYAITDIDLIDKNQRMSLSIDEFDNVIPVILLVPELKEKEHDHIHLEKDGDLKRFLNILKLKGSNYMNVGYYRLETSHHVVSKELAIKLDLFMFKSNNPSEGVDKLYSVNITKQGLEDISNWIDEFYSKSDSELNSKYLKDSKA